VEDRNHIIPDCIAKGDDSLAYSSLIGRQMLSEPLRDYVIKDIKRPLRKVLELVVRRFRSKFGIITPDRVTFRVTRNLMGIWDKVLSCHRNPGRDGIFQAARDVSLWEVEHDPYYRHIVEVMAEVLVEQVLAGEWEPRPEGYPYHQWWDEPEPYGGKYSIIARINAHKDKINKILNKEAECRS